MYQVLRAEGLTQLEFFAVMDSTFPWSSEFRTDDFDKATFPIAMDTMGVAYMYGASPYDAYLIDKKGRLVAMAPSCCEDQVQYLNKRIRALHAE